MRYKVEILPSAWEDLKRIEDYYILQILRQSIRNFSVKDSFFEKRIDV